MNVDHIKRLSRRWDLRLAPKNLQTACASLIEAMNAQAQERGLTIGEWIAELSGQIIPRPDRPVDERPIWEILAAA
jgi:hypothetical protein